MSEWTRLASDLDRQGRTARFFLRDDDAIAPTPAFDRLLALTRHYDVPLLLAVIPKRAETALAERLAAEPLVSPCQHGWSHRNHAPAGERAAEIGLHRPMDAVLDDLARGRARLQALFGDRLDDALVPPWNRMGEALMPHLAILGFDAVSRFGETKLSVESGIARIDTHLDLIDWKNGRKGRDEADILGKLSALLAAENPTTIGVLTHHLDHDEQAWDVLEKLLAATREKWLSFDAVRRAARMPQKV